MTNLKQMTLVMQLNDITQKMLDAQEQQNNAIQDLLDTMNEYIDWAAETMEGMNNG